jgi:hypothetical protein
MWGDPDSRENISLGGHLFDVTLNLGSALRNLRDEGKSRTLWIDAICVDQQNLEERSSQVLLMTRIFQKATRTVSWLGNSSPYSKIAFDFMQSGPFDSLGFVHSDEFKHSDHVNKLSLFLLSDHVRDGIIVFTGDLARRAYFRRIWVVQELALSNVGIPIPYGK